MVPRRLRKNQLIRNLTAETSISKNKLIMPYFVMEGTGLRQPVHSMPGIDRVCLEQLCLDIEKDMKHGITQGIFFGIPQSKNESGSESYNPEGIIQKAIQTIKKKFPEFLIISDVCLCEYTSHGHCGILKNGLIDNESTLPVLAKIALSHAEAGADIIAPSDMMDGRINTIRNMLDSHSYDIPLLSYAAKYSSAFYGPFRDAAGSSPQLGDRKSYQMDFRNRSEAIKEVLLDISEGADMVMVKPALAYMDILQKVKESITVPLCAYNVSGEYTMVKLMHEKGFGVEQNLVTEILTGLFRAGADMIISYHTRDIFRNKWL